MTLKMEAENQSLPINDILFKKKTVIVIILLLFYMQPLVNIRFKRFPKLFV